jgi:hypothetical protein
MFTCAYPEPHESSPSPPILFREDSLNIPPSTPGSSKCSVFLCFCTETMMHPPHMCHMLRLSYLP